MNVEVGYSWRRGAATKRAATGSRYKNKTISEAKICFIDQAYPIYAKIDIKRIL